MNRKTKQILQENNQYEKQLSSESKKAMTDIVVYLRGCDLSEFHQEEVRRDIMEMVLDGEKRGEDIHTVIGEDYQTFCDNIVKVFPPRTRKDKILMAVNEILPAISILLIIWLVSSLIDAGILKKSMYALPLTVGNLLNGIICLVLAVTFVEYICKKSFKIGKKKTNKVKTFIITWIIIFIITGSIFLIDHYLTMQIIMIPIFIAVILIILPLLLSYCIDHFCRE